MLAIAIVGMTIRYGLAWADPLDSQPTDADSSDKDAAKEKSNAAVDALQTQPQVPAVRGGTLGIPSVPGTFTAQVVVSGQPASTASTDTSTELPA